MLGFSPKLPVTDDERAWVDEGFRRLEKFLGRRRMLECRVIRPCPDDFPDAYDKSPACAELLFRRVCEYMQVERAAVELEVFQDETEELRATLPHWSGQSSGCAGFYTHEDGDLGDKRMFVALRSTQLQEPVALVATMAHELGHAILLGRGLISAKTPDHEPLTDLLTVFLGLGIFTANASGRFRQFQYERKAGWSMHRLGYLDQEIYGYALARFALERQEHKPEWEKYLSTNVRAYYKQSRKWLIRNPQYVALATPIQ